METAKENILNRFSELLEEFYARKDNQYHIKQKAHDIRRLVSSNIERCARKLELQIKSINDAKNRDFYRLCGELITANMYSIEDKSRQIYRA